MRMDRKYLQTLELNKILERLAEHTSFSAGRELALALQPSTDVEEVRSRQHETAEAKFLLSVNPGLSLGGARDVRPLLKNAEIGATLDPAALLDVQTTLVSAKALRRGIVPKADQYPTLAAIAHGLEECPKLVAEIARCINDNGEVLDSASPALARIRRALAVARDRLLDRLNRLLGSSDSAAYLQEALITQRGGRYVIPVKAEYKGRVQGIVHDQSASGATLFIEPLAIVELGNQWRELQLDEQREVERILGELTALVAAHVTEIRSTVDALAQLDLAFAKAQYAFAIKAVEPALLDESKTLGVSKTPRVSAQKSAKTGEVLETSPVSQEGEYLRLIRARHPLLSAETVVPIDVHLGGDFSILVVTGPNTGGKTVALKTIGLLAAMAQCGLQIPAMEGSAFRVFSGLYADIGDEQSIEQSLSTFSSHMGNIITILAEADEQSLVLLDELGAGTDPTEGSALARAVLSELLRRRIPAMATTHYAELKLFAQATAGVENASVEFDVRTLSPTFKLTVGLPGRSNAFAIAKRLGLPQGIIDAAQQYISAEDVEADRLLERVRQSRHELGRATNAAQTALSTAREKDKEASRLLREADRERRELLAEARAQLEEAQEELERIRKAVERQEMTRERLDEAAKNLQQLQRKQKAIEPAPSSAAAETARARAQLAVGDTVWVSSLSQIGQVMALAHDEAEVQVGLFRAQVPLLDLEKRAAVAPPPGQDQVRVSLAPRRMPGLELHLRGMRVDEVLPELNKYLDDAYLAGLLSVRIVHGKGTGTLRQVVRDVLAEHPLVASFRDGELKEGGAGVTVAKLQPKGAG
jgi:DNA mismatch repair protein MutS2